MPWLGVKGVRTKAVIRVKETKDFTGDRDIKNFFHLKNKNSLPRGKTSSPIERS
jgi:hypothetical protein